MADLRTALYTGNGNLSADQLARIDAADMGTLRRSYTGGRITNDINPMLADIASLEADGTPEARTKAAGLRDQVSALEQRRAAYAPEVGKVENINGIMSCMDATPCPTCSPEGLSVRFRIRSRGPQGWRCRAVASWPRTS